MSLLELLLALSGGLLLAGALLMARPTPLRSHLFIAGWAACLGMLFGSFLIEAVFLGCIQSNFRGKNSRI